jgi:SAM-dependent methyltransferase
MYAASPDPWGFQSRWYEKRKHAISVDILPERFYAEAFEPGGSIGVLTELLAARCGHVLSCDVAEAAVRAAAQRTRALPNVRVERRVIPRDWPPGQFDLVVLSEFLYYFAGDDLDRVLDLVVSATRDGGSVLAVHWRHPVPEYPRGGDEVHRSLAGRNGLARLVEHREPDFVAEVFIRTDGEPVSVAQAAGLA